MGRVRGTAGVTGIPPRVVGEGLVAEGVGGIGGALGEVQVASTLGLRVRRRILRRLSAL